MDEDLINEISILNPDIKIIINIRHPVERAWSHAKKDLLRNPGRELQELKFHEFVSFYKDQYQLQCGSYSIMIPTWTKIISPAQIFVLFFEDIAKKPRQLLKNIVTFLGVSPQNKYFSEHLYRSIFNYTSDIGFPVNHRTTLYALFKQEIQWLNNKFNLNYQ